MVGVVRSRRRGLAPYVLSGILAALTAVASAQAQSPLTAKRAEAQRLFAQVQQLDVSLGGADERLNLANLRLAQVQRDLVVNKHELGVAEHNLARSQKAIAQRLVTLYTSPQTSTLEVILGASSLEDMLTQVDNASKISSLDTQVLNQVYTFKSAVKRHRAALVRARAASKRLVAERAAEKRSIATQLGERRRLLSSLNGEIATLEAEQQARELQLARQARARMVEAQAAAQQDFSGTVVGAFAATPETGAVVPPSGYSGAVGVAMSFLGTPYVWGGATPGGFDCSGLVMYAYQAVGVSLPHSSYAMWGYGVPVPSDQLEPGDLVFFDGLGHVGMYIGGGDFVHAPHTGTVVQVSSLSSYGGSFVGARRIL
jgi:cell wall-associated NlpC family hydrolase